MKNTLLTLVLIFSASTKLLGWGIGVDSQGNLYNTFGSTTISSDGHIYAHVGNTMIGTNGNIIVKTSEHTGISTSGSLYNYFGEDEKKKEAVRTTSSYSRHSSGYSYDSEKSSLEKYGKKLRDGDNRRHSEPTVVEQYEQRVRYSAPAKSLLETPASEETNHEGFYQGEYYFR